MKKIILIIFVLFGFLIQEPLRAQSFCAGIKLETFALNPQMGTYNHFGVRVTLDMYYDQNVTVSGYLYDANGTPNTNHPFSVTVTAGNYTGETSATYLELSAAIESITAEFASASPSTLTNNGVSFSTGCSTSSPGDRLNAIGQLHNDYMDYVLGYISSQNMDFSDTSSLKSTMQTKTNTFLTNHGFSTASISMNFGGLAAVSNISYSSGNYSTAGAGILSSLYSLIAGYDPDNDAGFLSSLTSLQADALALSNPNEVYTVGIPVTVAMYSYSYWKTNAQSWADIFNDQDSVRHLTAFIFPQIDNSTQSTSLIAGNIDPTNFSVYESPELRRDQKLNEAISYFKFKLGVGQLVAADVGGAIGGGIDGVVLGPGGVLAGAILGSACGSIGNIAGQLMSHFFSWW